MCCGVIGFILVAMQLDFTIALSGPATAVFSFLVAISLSQPRPPADRHGLPCVTPRVRSASTSAGSTACAAPVPLPC